MNTIKSCVPCVCSSSGHRRVCEEHNIGAQCGATTTNTATETVEHSGAKRNQKNLQNQLNILTKLKSQQNQQKFIRQLEVVPSPAEVCKMTQLVTKQPLCPARCPDGEDLHT